MHPKQLLTFVLTGALLLPAQQTPPTTPSAATPAAPNGGLEIVVTAGEGAQNNVRARTAVAPAVEVREGGKPLPNAEVIFQLPPIGPSGAFNGWLKSQTVRTNEQGVAAVTNYTPNTEEGRFNIKVTAASGAKTGQAIIAQSNVSGNGGATTTATTKKSNWWKWALGIGAAAGIGIGIAAAAGGDDDDATNRTPVSVSAGPVTVGGPR